MEIIRSLINLLNKHRTHYRDNTGLPTDKNSKLYQLANELKEGKYTNEDSVAQMIYGTDANSIKFKRLSYRLKNRLLNSFLLIDPEKIFTSRIDKDFFLVSQQQTICSILAYLGEKKIAYSIAKSGLPKAKTSFNPYAGINLALHLRVYASNNGDQKKFNKYNKEVKYFQQYINTETELSTMAQEYKFLANHPKTELYQVKEMLDRFLIRIGKMKIDYSPRTVYFAYSLFLSDRTIKRDLPGTIKCCREGLKMMRPFNRPNLENLFYYAMVEGHILLKEFEKGKALIFSVLKKRDLSNYNILSGIYYYASLCLATENYQYLGEALQLFKENKIDKSAVAFFKESFIFFEMLYFILVTLDKTEITYPIKSKIRITKFINDLPVFSKDKKGSNTLILFIQILLLLIKKDHEKIIDRVDNLKTYDKVYLRKEDSYRSNCFLRMILLIPKHNFHPVAVKRHSAPYLKKLSDHKENNWNWKTTNVETIPYENFWNLFIEVLERNKKK